MLTIILIASFILLAALLAFASTRPDTFRVQRAARIPAPPNEILPLIADFKRWADWSPWEKLDPAMKRTLSGAASGQGAVYEWAGNAKAGQGRMEITGMSSAKVTINLDFLKPFECRTFAEFTLQAAGDCTNVVWAMHGPQSYLAKVMTMFFNRDRMVGKDFEKGLASLQAVVETQPRRVVCN